MSDQLEELFNRYRPEGVQAIRVPGVPAARHTVRRRRVAYSATGAGLAALALLGAGVLMSGSYGEDLPAATPAETTAEELASHAAALLGPVSEPLRGTLVGDGAASRTVVGGGWRALLRCSGEGTVTVTVAVAGTDRNSGTVPCGAENTTVVDAIRVPQGGGEVTLRAQPDEVAAGRSGVAFALELPPAEKTRLEDSAVAVLGEAATGMSLFVENGGNAMSFGEYEPGSYRVRLSCVGAGQVAVKVVQDNWQQKTDGRVDCAKDGRTSSLSFELPAGEREFVLWFTPNAAADGQSAVAVEVASA